MCKVKTFKVQKQEKIHKMCNFLFSACFILFLASTVARIYVYNDLAVKNGDLRNTFDSQKALVEEITLLKYQDSALSSMTYIESKAVEMGFTPMQERLLTINTSSSGAVASIAR